MMSEKTHQDNHAGVLDLVAWTQLWHAIAETLPAPRASRLLRVLRTIVEVGGAGAAGSMPVHMDALAEDRSRELLPKIQANVPHASVADVLRGAMRVGLNRLCAPKSEYGPADFAPKAKEDVRCVQVTIEPDDVPRVAAIVALHGIHVDYVVGAALCTGLAMLSGINVPIEGPFKGN